MKVHNLVKLLKETDYDQSEIQFLEEGFTHGFDIRYQGPTVRASNASNIPLRIGSETELWNKLIKEVRLKCVAGPFDTIPYDNYIQSPIGLVPKSGNTEKTRLIFHLSYDFDDNKSLNTHTPKEICMVKYNDLDHVIHNCLEAKKQADDLLQNGVIFEEEVDEGIESTIYLSKTDVQSAFHLVPLSAFCWCWLIMMAHNLITKKYQFFVDKCLPFSASISCVLFQCFSNALHHITQVKSGYKTIMNYLDDFLFISYARRLCRHMLETFLNICKQVGVPISPEKTEWPTQILVFLGILLNGTNMTLAILEEKCNKAIHLLSKLIDKKKATVKEIQNLCGYLNFLNRAIHPGRAFMRRMYAKYLHLCDKNVKQNSESDGMAAFTLKFYHHVKLDAEFKSDFKVWLRFLTDQNLYRIVNRPMIDQNMFTTSKQIAFFTDTSAAENLGYSCVFRNNWTYGQWEKDFIKNYHPSIKFLELYALCVGFLTWQDKITDCQIIVWCDNMGVVGMVNNLASKCPKCMLLIRIITLNNLIYNRRVSVRYIRSADNILSDALSRLDFNHFRKHGKHMNLQPDSVNSLVSSTQNLFQLQQNLI